MGDGAKTNDRAWELANSQCTCAKGRENDSPKPCLRAHWFNLRKENAESPDTGTESAAITYSPVLFSTPPSNVLHALPSPTRPFQPKPKHQLPHELAEAFDSRTRMPPRARARATGERRYVPPERRVRAVRPA
uniref:Uncharacterized protein n=1 Tax=Oryza glumipatula TaxID=40148 RepID=A0A0D9ZLZ8_9ORYZ